MVIAVVEYRLNTASVAEIAEHLTCCDANFLPPLSARVEISSYAKKIASKATRFEAWAAGALVGLLAMYCNDYEKRTAFVTSVSVLPAWTGTGIGTYLLNQCIRHSQAMKMREISLEVGVDNYPAIKLYSKRGFILARSNSGFASMSLILEGEGRHERQA